jgi:PAS domain S-box-containing protein
MISVLYVDDEPILLEIGKLYLEQSGEFGIDTLTSAHKALKTLNNKNYDAIISDYLMPAMDGIEFLKKIRTSGNTIPFIIFTGKGREEVVIQALNAGADFYLQKGGDPKVQFVELAHMITQAVRRKKGEDALRKSEKRYRNVVESQTEFIVRFLPDGTHKVANAAYCRYFGKSCEEMINSRFIPNIPEEDKGRVRQHFASLMPENAVATIEHRIIMPDGSVRWQQWSDRALFDANRTLIEYQSVGRDITDRKRAEEELLRKNEELQAAYEELTTAEEELRQNYDELATMEKNLRESEQRYRNVVEDQTEFISRFLPDGTHVFVNEAYCRYFNKKREEILGTKFIPEIPEEDRSLVKQHFASLSQDTPVAMIEHRIVMPDGQVRWQRWSDRAIFDAGGRVTEYQSVGRDTTDRKEAEELVQRSEIRYRSLFEGVPVGLYRTTPAGQILDANPALVHILGYPDRESLLAISVPDLYANPAARKEWQTRIEHEGILRDFEAQFRKCDGTTILVRETSKAVRDDSGQVVYYEGILEGITDRKNLEMALRESEERYRTFFTTSMDCAFITSVDGKWLDFNDSAVHFFGYATRDELQKINVRDLYENSHDRKRHLAYIREKGYSKEYPVNLKKKDGTIINTLITTVPRKDKDGTIIGFQGTIRDITDQRLTQEALFQANKKLNLLSSITRHDILNQLTVLEGYLKLSEEFVHVPANVGDFIKKEIKAAETIENQIGFTRVYQNMGVNAPTWQNANANISRAVAALPMRNIRVKMDCTDFEVLADPLLEKVFFNLVDNALRHGGDTMTTVRFSSHESDSGMMIVCEDDGVGISRKDKKYLFERGFGKHTGFGLYLIREILSITGITISETGEPGKGARFEILVPKGGYRFEGHP